jgi:hypothetical protein
MALAGLLCAWLIFARPVGAGSVVLGILAAGGWSLVLVPVHSAQPGERDRRAGNCAKREKATPQVPSESQLRRPGEAD